MMKTKPLNTNSNIDQTLSARKRMASGALRITPDLVIVIPAATAAKMPENPICSAIMYEANGSNSMKTICVAGSSPLQRLIRRKDLLYSHVTIIPASKPPTATLKNSIVTPDVLNTIVPIAIATANFNATKPEASFISASPSRTLIIRLGIRPLPTIEDNATASVGESTAARANAAISGIPGINQ